MKSASRRRDAKSPSDGSLPYHPGILATSLLTFIGWGPSTLQPARGPELLALLQAERIEAAARRDFQARLAAFEEHRHDEALGLRGRLDIEALEQAEQRPRAVEDDRVGARCGRQLDLRSDTRTRPRDRHRRVVAGEELEDRAIDLEV